MRYSEAIKPTASAESRALTEAKLARGPLDLVELLDEIEFPAKTNLLVLVDQFEEIFRYLRGETSDEVDAFVALLLASASQRKRPIYIVITMRSDFLGECAQFNNLAETINDGAWAVLAPRGRTPIRPPTPKRGRRTEHSQIMPTGYSPNSRANSSGLLRSSFAG
jgi:hypothetical protein